MTGVPGGEWSTSWAMIRQVEDDDVGSAVGEQPAQRGQTARIAVGGQRVERILDERCAGAAPGCRFRATPRARRAAATVRSAGRAAASTVPASASTPTSARVTSISAAPLPGSGAGGRRSRSSTAGRGSRRTPPPAVDASGTSDRHAIPRTGLRITPRCVHSPWEHQSAARGTRRSTPIRTMTRSRTVICAVLVALALPGAALAGTRNGLPRGNAGAYQYVESIPTAHGARPDPSVSPKPRRWRQLDRPGNATEPARCRQHRPARRIRQPPRLRRRARDTRGTPGGSSTARRRGGRGRRRLHPAPRWGPEHPVGHRSRRRGRLSRPRHRKRRIGDRVHPAHRRRGRRRGAAPPSPPVRRPR